MKKTLIICGCQNDFCDSSGKRYIKGSDIIINNICNYINDNAHDIEKIIFILEESEINVNNLNNFDYCKKYSFGAAIPDIFYTRIFSCENIPIVFFKSELNIYFNTNTYFEQIIEHKLYDNKLINELVLYKFYSFKDKLISSQGLNIITDNVITLNPTETDFVFMGFDIDNKMKNTYEMVKTKISNEKINVTYDTNYILQN